MSVVGWTTNFSFTCYTNIYCYHSYLFWERETLAPLNCVTVTVLLDSSRPGILLSPGRSVFSTGTDLCIFQSILRSFALRRCLSLCTHEHPARFCAHFCRLPMHMVTTRSSALVPFVADFDTPLRFLQLLPHPRSFFLSFQLNCLYQSYFRYLWDLRH